MLAALKHQIGDAVLWEAREAAAQRGQSLLAFIMEAVELAASRPQGRTKQAIDGRSLGDAMEEELRGALQREIGDAGDAVLLAAQERAAQGQPVLAFIEARIERASMKRELGRMLRSNRLASNQGRRS